VLTLACVALLGGVTALAVLHRLDVRDAEAASTEPETAVPAGGGWMSALAGTRGPVGDAERTPCNLILTERSLGVTHSVLPCGAKIVIRFGNRRVLTEVIDTKLKGSGRQFEVTDALARVLDLDGTQKIEWRFALPASR
jgi:hypothetical protein